MTRIILILWVLSNFIYAGFMDSVGDVVKSTLSDNDDNKMPKIETVGTVQTIGRHGDNHKKDSLIGGMLDSVKDTIDGKSDKPKRKSKEDSSLFNDMVSEVKETIGLEDKPKRRKSKKDDSLFDDMVSGVKGTIGIKEDKPKKKTSFMDDTLTAMKEVAGMEKVKEDNSIFDGGIMGTMADMIDLEKGESMGLPSVFGYNKKKQKKVFGSTILGDTILGDTKEATTGFYRGFKRTGESTEFMSGVMYKSSKVYNGMFEMFDDSLFNVFDDKDEREPSVFDVFDQGNSMLDIFD